MINVLNMTKTGVVNNIPEFKFEFEFDSASTLPVKTYVLGQKTYLIAKDSTAKNLSTNTYYKYGGVDDKWVKVLPTPTPTPVDNTKITDNGDYSLINNDFAGYNEVSVDVANSFTPADEGKVVSDGTLVAQTVYPTEITENDTYDTTNYNSITVNVSGGGGGTGGSDVIFYDYDGTVVQSYSAADFASLSAMPDNPTHEGLTAQGWNWSLADAKAYVAAYGKLNIGQMYITSDGKTRFYLTLINNALTVELWWIHLQDGTTVDIDWGDDSEHTTWNKGEAYKSHTYSVAGDYVMTITVIAGSFYLYSSDSDEVTTVRKIEMGNNVTFNEQDTFLNFYKLEYITIPNGITEIGTSAFCYCNALKALILPSTLTSIDEQAVNGCYSLSALSIGRGITSIGDYSISGSYSLTSITIPDTVTTLGNTAIDDCNVLSEVIIPNSITAFPDNFLQNCYLLQSVIIPENVATIGEYFLKYCGGLSSITFKSTTPPTLAASMNTLPRYCVIRVPQGTLSAYTSASNYPDPAYYVYEEY